MKSAVKQIAVENFLDTIDVSIGEYGNILNARADRDCYKWNNATFQAIVKGIREKFKDK